MMAPASAADTILSNESEPGANPACVPPIENQVSANVKDLIVGRVLRYPIYDNSGLLLLAEGMTLTKNFKEMLEQRCISSVKVHANDLPHLTFCGEAVQEEPQIKLDTDLVKSLDEIVDTGLLFVVNSETALLEQMANHGCKNYQREKFLDRINRNKDTSVFVDNLMRNALQGKKVNCGDITRLTANYLNDITSDIDSTLAAKLDMIQQNQISDHCVGMAILGMAIGVELGMDVKNVRTIALAGLLNDWGMIRIPKEIREADRRLTENEYFEITKHPMYTLRILDEMCGVPTPVPLICYQVHERPNGEGYPQGRKADRIHPIAKILSVADAYNALITPRPYRPPLIPYAAMECILRQAAVGDFDIQVTRALLMIQSLFPIGSYVVLSDSSVGRVLRRNGDKFTQPIVKIIQDKDGNRVPDDSEQSIVDLNAAGLEVVKALPPPGSNAIEFNEEILRLGRRCVGESEIVPGRKASILQMFCEKSTISRNPNSAEMISVEDYTEKQRRLAYNALDLLKNTREKSESLYGTQRQHARKAVQTLVKIHIPDLTNQFANLQSGCNFSVITNDISQGGMSFVYPDRISKEEILIELPSADKKNNWFLGKISCSRLLGDTGFWMHGVSFQRKVAM